MKAPDFTGIEEIKRPSQQEIIDFLISSSIRFINIKSHKKETLKSEEFGHVIEHDEGMFHYVDRLAKLGMFPHSMKSRLLNRDVAINTFSGKTVEKNMYIPANRHSHKYKLEVRRDQNGDSYIILSRVDYEGNLLSFGRRHENFSQYSTMISTEIAGQHKIVCAYCIEGDGEQIVSDLFLESENDIKNGAQFADLDSSLLGLIHRIELLKQYVYLANRHYKSPEDTFIATLLDEFITKNKHQKLSANRREAEKEIEVLSRQFYTQYLLDNFSAHYPKLSEREMIRLRLLKSSLAAQEERLKWVYGLKLDDYTYYNKVLQKLRSE